MTDYERLQDELMNSRNSAQAARRIMYGLLSDSDVHCADMISELATDLLTKLRRKAREQSLAGVDAGPQAVA